MATEILPKSAPLALKTLPQKPAAKLPWSSGEGEVLPDLLKIPDHRPDVLVFVKTPSGYMKAMEIERNGESLFGAGQAAKDFTGILTEAISSKLSLSCPSVEIPAIAQMGESLRHIETQLETKRKIDDFTAMLFGIAIAGATLAVLAFFIINKLRER